MTLALCLLSAAWAQLVLFFCCLCLDTKRLHKAPRLAGLPAPGPLPPVAVMVPVTGRNDDTETALRSLLEQDYPSLTVYLAVCGTADPAYAPASKLAARYAHARLVDAPEAVRSGQKNQNLLSCLEAVDPDTAVYVFCDANHRAEPDFVRKLVHPVLLGKADFCTGYRRSRLYTPEPAATAFHAVNRFMLFLQSLPFFTQPWGGATAARAAAFKRLDVAGLWRRTVVDDSALAGLLGKRGIPVLFCPDALLESSARSLTRNALDEWLFRQLFYPRLYTFGAWLLIGFCLVWFAAACAACPYILFLALRGSVPFTVLAAALLVPCGQMLLQEFLRRRVAGDCPRSVWFKGLVLAITALYGNYARTVTAGSMVWRGIRYVLGADGRVLGVRRKGNASGTSSGEQAT